MLCNYYSALTGDMKEFPEFSKLVNEAKLLENESKLLEVVDDWKLYSAEKSGRDELVEIDELGQLLLVLLFGEARAE